MLYTYICCAFFLQIFNINLVMWIWSDPHFFIRIRSTKILYYVSAESCMPLPYHICTQIIGICLINLDLVQKQFANMSGDLTVTGARESKDAASLVNLVITYKGNQCYGSAFYISTRFRIWHFVKWWFRPDALNTNISRGFFMFKRFRISNNAVEYFLFF